MTNSNKKYNLRKRSTDNYKEKLIAHTGTRCKHQIVSETTQLTDDVLMKIWFINKINKRVKETKSHRIFTFKDVTKIEFTITSQIKKSDASTQTSNEYEQKEEGSIMISSSKDEEPSIIETPSNSGPAPSSNSCPPTSFNPGPNSSTNPRPSSSSNPRPSSSSNPRPSSSSNPRPSSSSNPRPSSSSNSGPAPSSYNSKETEEEEMNKYGLLNKSNYEEALDTYLKLIQATIPSFSYPQYTSNSSQCRESSDMDTTTISNGSSLNYEGSGDTSDSS